MRTVLKMKTTVTVMWKMRKMEDEKVHGVDEFMKTTVTMNDNGCSFEYVGQLISMIQSFGHC